MKQQWKRFLSLTLALLVVLSMMSVQAFATEDVAETEEPTVTETVEETEETAVTEAVETSAPEEPTDPVPETTVPDQSSEPEEDAAVASVQALIDALPEAEDITEENREDVVKLLEAIDEAKADLSDGQWEKLNFDKYEAAASALGEDHTPALLAQPDVRTICARVGENTAGTLTLEYYLSDESDAAYTNWDFKLKYPTDTLVLKSIDAPEGAAFAGDGFVFWPGLASGMLSVSKKGAVLTAVPKDTTLFTATFEVQKTGTIEKTELGFSGAWIWVTGGDTVDWTDGGLVLSEGETSLSVTRGTDFAVTGGTEGTDWKYNAGDKTLEILTGTALTIAMKDGVTSTTDRIEVIADADTGNLTLDGIHIETSSNDGAVAAHGDLNLTLVGKNTIVSTGNGQVLLPEAVAKGI